jgi:hypothetical protein
MAGLLRELNLPSPTEQVTSRQSFAICVPIWENAVAIWLGWVSMTEFDVPLAQ